jgi:hypothetical protein
MQSGTASSEGKSHRPPHCEHFHAIHRTHSHLFDHPACGTCVCRASCTRRLSRPSSSDENCAVGITPSSISGQRTRRSQAVWDKDTRPSRPKRSASPDRRAWLGIRTPPWRRGPPSDAVRVMVATRFVIARLRPRHLGTVRRPLDADLVFAVDEMDHYGARGCRRG